MGGDRVDPTLNLSVPVRKYHALPLLNYFFLFTPTVIIRTIKDTISFYNQWNEYLHSTSTISYFVIKEMHLKEDSVPDQRIVICDDETIY